MRQHLSTQLLHQMTPAQHHSDHAKRYAHRVGALAHNHLGWCVTRVGPDRTPTVHKCLVRQGGRGWLYTTCTTVTHTRTRDGDRSVPSPSDKPCGRVKSRMVAEPAATDPRHRQPATYSSVSQDQPSSGSKVSGRCAVPREQRSDQPQNPWPARLLCRLRELAHISRSGQPCCRRVACRDDGLCRAFWWLRDGCCDAVLGCAFRWLWWRWILLGVFEWGWLPQLVMPLSWIAATEGGLALAMREVWPRCCDADTGWAWREQERTLGS